MGVVACEGMAESTLTPVPTATTMPAPAVKNIKANIQGVQINMRVPPGWSGRTMNDGILVTEKRGSLHNTGKLMGMQVYIFVHAVNDFPKPVNISSHPASHILQQIIAQPDLVGNSAVSNPQSFNWDGNDAAYYLLNDTNQSVTLVMAVVIANDSQLVTINISCPSERAGSIRDSLPDLLADLWVNGALMSVSGIDALPDPLIFPTYPKSSTPDTTPTPDY
ncbi:MAG: hypothetical protein H0X30_14445 [Anaerolineae bacterium]|nr:hypothetical protein [Anaerolineae bacterium]